MEQIKQRVVTDEMRESYVDYAMSVIVGRALPDARDGLKPVHRRVLYAMHELGLVHSKPHKKCARIVGEVLGKFHPHGDVAVYDALVRMAQNFSLRYPLVDGQGNFGSIDGDNAAHMRYTEARMSKIAEELLIDIDKETVDFAPNFDSSLKEPVILPSRFPNLLVNGSSGIAVGMATSIPPHNINEITDAIVFLIDNPTATVDEVMLKVSGPDFPTGGVICGRNGIIEAYKQGKAKLRVRGKTEISEGRIIVTEIPYQVNKSQLLEGVVELVKSGILEGIQNIRDESDRNGMRVVIGLKKMADANVVLNQLYKYTQLQTTFSVIFLALVDNEPKIMNLKEMIEQFIVHRKKIIIKKTTFDLEQARARAHILSGLIVALDDIDPIIALVKSAKDPQTARLQLMNSYKLSELQAQAILDMKLQRLTSLEHAKVKEEHDTLLETIIELKGILASEPKIFDIIKQEMLEQKKKYGDERRTTIIEEETEIETEDMIEKEDMLVTITQSGYIKRTPLELYKKQGRGGKGIVATETKEGDIVNNLFVTTTHSHTLFFTDIGRVYWLKTYKIPLASRYSKGKAIVNLLNLSKDEAVSAVLPVADFDEKNFLIMATKHGMIKKTRLEKYSRPRKAGIVGIKLRKDDELTTVRLTPGGLNMVLATKNGMAMEFNDHDVRPMSRSAGGVRGIKLRANDEVIGLEVAKRDATLLTITNKGYGKRTAMSEYRMIKRGGRGVTNFKCNDKTGNVIGIKTVMEHDEIICTTTKGVVIRIEAKNISVIGRATQGVRVMKLDENDSVANVTRVVKG